MLRVARHSRLGRRAVHAQHASGESLPPPPPQPEKVAPRPPANSSQRLEWQHLPPPPPGPPPQTLLTKDAASGISIVDFGMHRGFSFQEVLKRHPLYCQWIVNKASSGERLPSPGFMAFAAYLKNAGMQQSKKERSNSMFSATNDQDLASGQWQFMIGKHQGLTFQQVAATDHAYCDWAIGQALHSTGPDIGDLVHFVAYVQHVRLKEAARTRSSLNSRQAQPERRRNGQELK